MVDYYRLTSLFENIRLYHVGVKLNRVPGIFLNLILSGTVANRCVHV